MSNLPVLPPTHVGERGGPWDSVALNPAFHPALHTTLPMTIVYVRDAALGWLPYLLVAESTLLSRVGGPPGLGVYALKRFRGPRESDANNGGRSASHRRACTQPAKHALIRPLHRCAHRPHGGCTALDQWRFGLLGASDPMCFELVFRRRLRRCRRANA